MKERLTKKFGPFPLWVWVAGGVTVAGLYAYYRNQQAMTTDTTQAQDQSSSDPTGVTSAAPASYAPGSAFGDTQGIYDPTQYGGYGSGGGFGVPSMAYGSTSHPLSDIASLITSLAAARVALGGTKGCDKAPTKPPKKHHYWECVNGKWRQIPLAKRGRHHGSHGGRHHHHNQGSGDHHHHHTHSNSGGSR